jgi:cytosine/adenosine deaminase-related metal-dependent hydrolase
MQDDRIVAVGKTDELPAEPSDDVIDGRGKLALPGVFDTHVHKPAYLSKQISPLARYKSERA